MPSVSGQIEFKDYTVFFTVPMVELQAGNLPAFLNSGRGIGLITDARADGFRNVLELIHDNAGTFLESMREDSQALMNAVGITVWQGDLVLAPDGTVTFNGTVRRPTPEDFALLGEINTHLDIEGERQAMEHARRCPQCAEQMGLDPNEVIVTEDEEVVGPHVGLLRTFTPGEA